ncbi:aspartate carbamoyltransferase [Sulfodiicoccus acidiphilus]|uniref:Aspartate carbamoyltransferase n=1 Tax=Sulfodiicoccus acidiphilus TaxID=1670455 RepID=A0A348B1B1_9CREN|nr:aspartate carbamoyltransferase [Sulfodiicoccus acidiphilus]BBD71963.1 aspartate carbamoyltransferase [Sulfodiicoccus acidiphilus]GGT91798.1 aspartate carbamoyltransferase [Sulfodiicoccus acidiphilus]
MKGRSLISASELSRAEYEGLFQAASNVRRSQALSGKIVALAFFEPSTRTYLSFETAAERCGASVIGFQSETSTSVAKGENLGDTIRMLSSYADLIVMRHKLDGAAKFASAISKVPVVNAGDGKHEHPTQSIVDLYSVWRKFGSIDGLTYGLLGDLKYSRTVNSLLRALDKFSPRKVCLVSPPQLRTRQEILDGLRLNWEEVSDVWEILSDLDVLYVTRIQRERFPDELEYAKVRNSYRVDLKMVEAMKWSSVIMHPLPRVSEIDRKVDKDRRAYYFQQASYGVEVRMALLLGILGE